MKKIDVRKQVMEKVVRYEKQRTGRWLVVFIATVVLLVALLFAALWIFAKELVERQTLELLTLLGEDQEIIAEFWQDTLTIFWEELPRRWLLGGIVLVMTLMILWVATRKKRHIIQKIRTQLAKYGKRG